MPATLSKDAKPIKHQLDATYITVTVGGYIVTAAGKCGSVQTTYTASIKNAAGTSVYNSTQTVPPATNFQFSTTLTTAGTYTMTITGTDGTNFHTSFPVPND